MYLVKLEFSLEVLLIIPVNCAILIQILLCVRIYCLCRILRIRIKSAHFRAGFFYQITPSLYFPLLLWCIPVTLSAHSLVSKGNDAALLCTTDNRIQFRILHFHQDQPVDVR